MLKPNNFPDLPRQAVYLPPHDDKYQLGVRRNIYLSAVVKEDVIRMLPYYLKVCHNRELKPSRNHFRGIAWTSAGVALYG